jgi:AhpD family alkylhydroperoxidase
LLAPAFTASTTPKSFDLDPFFAVTKPSAAKPRFRSSRTDGALSTKMKQIVAVAVAHVTQCPYCINGHTKAALRAGATPESVLGCKPKQEESA